jgi:hypothetical protein
MCFFIDFFLCDLSCNLGILFSIQVDKDFWKHDKKNLVTKFQKFKIQIFVIFLRKKTVVTLDFSSQTLVYSFWNIEILTDSTIRHTYTDRTSAQSQFGGFNNAHRIRITTIQVFVKSTIW